GLSGKYFNPLNPVRFGLSGSRIRSPILSPRRIAASDTPAVVIEDSAPRPKVYVVIGFPSAVTWAPGSATNEICPLVSVKTPRRFAMRDGNPISDAGS